MKLISRAVVLSLLGVSQAFAQQSRPDQLPISVVSGPLKRSDVPLSTIAYRSDWLSAYQSFAANRIVWTYGFEDYIREATPKRIPVQCALDFWVPPPSANIPNRESMICTGWNKQPIIAAPDYAYPDINSTAWRAYALKNGKAAIDRGCTSFQQDGALLNYHLATRPTAAGVANGCYSPDSISKFRATFSTTISIADVYLRTRIGGNLRTKWVEFQKKSTIEYHSWLHNALNTYAANKPYPYPDIVKLVFSANFHSFYFNKDVNWLIQQDFDFLQSEINGDYRLLSYLRQFARLSNSKLRASIARILSSDITTYRRGIASAYALGLTISAPWDLHLPPIDNCFDGRFCAPASEIAPLYKMIRKHQGVFDNYVAQGDAFNPASGLVFVRGSSSPYFITVRKGAQNVQDKVVHVVSWGSLAASTLYLKKIYFPKAPTRMFTSSNSNAVEIFPLEIGNYYVYALPAVLWAVLYDSSDQVVSSR